MDHERGEFRLVAQRQLTELSHRGGDETARWALDQVLEDRPVDREHGPRRHREPWQGDGVAREHHPGVGRLAETDVHQEERLVAGQVSNVDPSPGTASSTANT
jgi:hypothetical protein